MKLTIKGTAEEIANQMLELIGCLLSRTVPEPAEEPAEQSVEQSVEPVITMAQMEEAAASAPAPEEPEQPTIEEVRAALKDLRDRKGAGAVKEVLGAYGVNSLPELKPEDYLGALARAKTEV